MGVPLSLKRTVPAGVPSGALIVAVNVTDWPKLAGLSDEARVVVVVMLVLNVTTTSSLAAVHGALPHLDQSSDIPGPLGWQMALG